MRLRMLLGIDEFTSGCGPLWRAVLTEFFTTVVLLTVCVGVGFPGSPSTPAPDLAAISIGGGMMVAVAMQISMHLSGAHLNPAVTVAFIAVGKVKLIRAALYIVAQCLAGITSSALLFILLPETLHHGLGVILPDPQLTNAQVFGFECLITAILLLAACAVSDPRSKITKGIEPIIIAFAVAACNVFTIKYTGCGLNPARVLGPAVIMQQWDYQWMYWAGEMVGGLLGALLYEYVLSTPEKPPKPGISHTIVLSEGKMGSRIIRRVH